MAKSAVEMALLDAELRRSGTSLATHLGAQRTEVPAGVSVGIAPVAELLDAVAGYVDAGYRRVKLKIGPGADIDPVRAVRECFGNHLQVQVDANGAYRLADADTLAALDDWGLLMIEQPLAEDDLLGHAELAHRLQTPICLDESITSARAAATAIALGACRVVNIKPGRVGGYLEARRVHDVCVETGTAAWCGGMLETGIGRAANLALAALPGFTLPGDVSPSDDYLTEDLTPPLVVTDGCVAVPTGPGIGVPILTAMVEQLTSAVRLIRPG
jgi:O-succinylbenzoate synthase